MPVVQLGYSYLMHDLFGPLERRLNRALRGLPATEDEAEPQVAPNRPVVRDEEEADGFRGAWANLARAVRGLFGDDDDDAADAADAADEPPAADWEVHHHLEVRIGGGGGGDNAEEEDTDEEDIIDVPNEAAQQQRDVPQEPQPQPQQQPPAAQQPEPQAAQNQNVEGGNAGNIAGENNDPASFFGLIVNSVVTSLLFPAISYSMGEIIRAIAPKGWVSPARSWRSRAPPGLLQQRWGRSLAGGCLFVVLRDALALYTKYRRVQVRTKRKIKNVDRKGQSKPQGGR